MIFEFDSNKSDKNKEKHRIDFYEAQRIWDDDNAIVIPAKNIEGERRYTLIGKLKGKCWICIFTIKNLACRIISVRRCRKNEEVIYEENLRKGV